MKLNQLRYYREVCRCGSISRAAENLHISQPSLSVSIRELEEEFGLRLLNRQGRGFTITAEGLEFLQGADALLSHADRFEKQMHSMQGEHRLRLGSPPMIGYSWLPRICTAASSAPVPVELEISEAGRHTMQTRLLEGQIDMAFLPHTAALPVQLESLPVTALEVVCCVSAGSPLAGLRHISADMLRGIPLVLFKNDFFITELVLQLFRDAGVEPKLLLQTEQVSTVHKMVSGRLATGFMLSNMAAGFSDLVSIPMEPSVPVRVSLAWRRGAWITSEMQWLMDYVNAAR